VNVSILFVHLLSLDLRVIFKHAEVPSCWHCCLAFGNFSIHILAWIPTVLFEIFCCCDEFLGYYLKLGNGRFISRPV
jgi:hypothetical protein